MNEKVLIDMVSKMVQELEKILDFVKEIVNNNTNIHKSNETSRCHETKQKTNGSTRCGVKETAKNISRMETINKAAEITGLSKHFIRQKAINGEIVCVKAGNKYLINIDRLIEYLNSGDTLKPAPTVSENGIKPIPVKL